MSEQYENFDLILTWHELEANNEIGRVSVRHKDLQGPETPYFKINPQDPLSILMSTNITRDAKKAQLIEAGGQVADLLLPANNNGDDIRAAFIDLWQQQRAAVPPAGVRLRIFYAGSENIAEPAVESQINKLLAIPWEFIYLPELGDQNIEDERHFLCRNRNISIVHSFKSPQKLDSPDQTDTENPMQVDRLLVDLAYLSWLGDDPNNQNPDLDEEMFKDFADELGGLNTVVDTSFLDSTPTNFTSVTLPIDAEPDDVVQALLDNDLVHLVFHSEPSKIYLKGDLGAQVTSAELAGYLEGRNIRAKAVLLIGCNSGDGGGSIAAALHRVNVPLVMSFTTSIKPSDARNFVNGFYRDFSGHPNHGLEQAVTNGRRLMFNKSDDDLKWFAGFATPRTFINRGDSVLVPESLLFGDDAMVTRFDDHVDDLIPEVEIKQEDDDLERIIEWVTQPDKAWFFVTGMGGIGKSTLIAKLINRVRKEQLNNVIFHFCRQNEPVLPDRHPADPLVFIRYSLVPQLEDAFEQYKTFVPKGRFPLLTGNTLQGLRDFILDPLRAIVGPDLSEPKPLIVIDDIDFFRNDQGFENSILKLLRDHWGDLVNVAQFLIAADVTNLVNGIHNELEALLGEPDLLIIPEQKPIVAVQAKLAPSARERFIDPAKAAGVSSCPLPLIYDIAQRIGSLSLEFDYKVPLEVVASAQGVNALYEALIATVTDPKKYPLGRKTQALLDVVATAYEPLYPRDTAILIGVNDNAMLELLQQLGLFFSDPKPKMDKPLILFHDSLKSYVQRDIIRGGRLSAVHHRFVAAARPGTDWADMQDWVSLSATPWGQHCLAEENQGRFSKVARREKPLATVLPRYVRRYLAAHAFEAYRTADLRGEEQSRLANDFLSLVCDPDFRTVRLIEVGREAALQDIRNALRVVYTEQALPRGEYDEAAVGAIDHLLAANNPTSITRLLNLEESIRLATKAQGEMEQFLGLPYRGHRINIAQIAP